MTLTNHYNKHLKLLKRRRLSFNFLLTFSNFETTKQGKLTYEDLSEMTFHDFIKEHFGLEIDGKKTMDEYRSYFNPYFSAPRISDCNPSPKKTVSLGPISVRLKK